MLRVAQIACLVTLGVASLGTLFIILGFACPNWVKIGDSHYGLWEECYSGSCRSIPFQNMNAEHIATAVLMIICLIFTISAMCSYSKQVTSSGLQITAGVFALISVGVFGSQKYISTVLDWAFDLTAAGGSFLFINGIALAIIAGMTGCNNKSSLPCRKQVEDETPAVVVQSGGAGQTQTQPQVIVIQQPMQSGGQPAQPVGQGQQQDFTQSPPQYELKGGQDNPGQDTA